MEGPLILGALSADGIGSGASRAGRLAFWVNAYNGLVAAGLKALGIRRSVWDVPDFFGRVALSVDGALWTADEIEHGVLRGNRPSPLATVPPLEAGDPRRARSIVPMDLRIHFAINCGARSCPAVRHYDAARVDIQLDAATRGYVGREITLEHGRLVLPELFAWFAADFEAHPGGLAAFLAAHLDEGPVRDALKQGGLADPAWRPWDWRAPLTPSPADTSA